MNRTRGDGSRDDRETFLRERRSASAGFLAEYVEFLRHNKKWWLLPILVALLLVGALIVLGSTAAAPFIYTLF